MTGSTLTLTNPGTPVEAIQQHYDVGNDFYELWLDRSMSYSCAMWSKDDPESDTLDAAQLRKIDFHIRQARAHRAKRVLDIGCGWGATLRRLVETRDVQHAVGLTLSANQAAWIDSLDDPRIECRLQSWSDYRPETRLDAIISIGAFEHFAHPDLTYDETVAAHRRFFQHCHDWLKPGGWFSLQTLVQMNMHPEDLHQVVKETLPELGLPTLPGIAQASEHLFEITALQNDRHDYVRTCGEWLARINRIREKAVAAAGEAVVARYEKWLKYCMISFHTGTAALTRITLRRIDHPASRKQQKAVSIPRRRVKPIASESAAYQGASVAAIQHHYDVGNEFYRLWLDPSLVYSCALWNEDTNKEDDTLKVAQTRKIDYFVDRAQVRGADRVLDVGCGWGAALRRLVDVHTVKQVVGLTLSSAQLAWIKAFKNNGIDARLENWFDHQPDGLYDGIISIAAFEAFAEHGLSEAEKIAAYRTFFQRCHQWLKPGGRLAVQTITYENFDRSSPNQFVSEIFAESDLPRLAEIAKASERIFEIVELRNDRGHYARTLKAWLSALKANRNRAMQLVGADVVAKYEKYLSYFIVGFHTGTMNLARITLRRIDHPRTEQEKPVLVRSDQWNSSHE